MELLSPAGNLQKLQFAIRYGADAVYIGANRFSLRSRAGNFDPESLEKAVRETHRFGKKLYLTLNAFLHESEWVDFQDFAREIAALEIDAYIVADPGVLLWMRENFPDKRLHISTQANTLSAQSVRFYRKLGVSRVVLARELSIDEIKSIRDKCDMELEAFVHGAMCIAYSGRCLLSNYMTNKSIYGEEEAETFQTKMGVRDANAGDCAQSCRWKYELSEKKRQGESYPISEDGRGTYILSSKDLNMASHLGDLMEAGVSSFKIEGRVKSLYYVAAVTRVYRYALDQALKGQLSTTEWLRELETVSHRPYTTGFFYTHNRLESLSTTHNNAYIRTHEFLAYGLEEGGLKAANQIKNGRKLELVTPDRGILSIERYHLLLDGAEVALVQPNAQFEIESDVEIRPWDIVRGVK